MPLQSLIKETIPLQGFKVVSVERMSFCIHVLIKPDRRYLPCCGRCANPGKFRDHRSKRQFQHMPVWGIAVYLSYTPRRVTCKHCQGVYVERMPWAAGKRRFTIAMACYLASWAKLLPWIEVARLFQCSWATVASSVAHVVEYGLANRDLTGITHIGIDEIARRKGHRYLTTVYDLRTRKLIWAGEGRSEQTLKKFFEFLGSERTRQLKGVCCDMWMPYINVISSEVPNAVMVFDKFHIVRHLMQAVDQVRRNEIKEKGDSHKQVLKHTRYIWLKNPWNLSSKQKQRLGALEKLNLKINRAYLLKECFRSFWSYKYKACAEKYLNKWFWWATHSRLKPLRNFAWMLRRHQTNILSYFQLPITNGSVEGLNNKAKVISRRAYGFRSISGHINNLYHCMADLPWPYQLHSFP